MSHKKEKLDCLWKEGLPEFTKGYSGIVLSCSGGTDSTALFHLLRRQIAFPESFPFMLLHFNFGLRGEESDQDQAFVQKLGKDYGIEVHIHDVRQHEAPSMDLKKKNVQSWARKIRQNVFKEFAKKNYMIALAHHKDDLAETILLRMIRGSSPGSLLGMQEWYAPYWRPLLDISREDILSWLTKNAFEFRTDSSNASLNYTRNVVRHLVLPQLTQLNSQARDHIIRCARETQDFVEFTRRSLLKLGESRENMKMDSNILKDLPKGVAYDVLSCGIGRLDGQGINHNTLEDALRSSIKLMENKKDGSRSHQIVAQLPQNKKIVEENGKISVVQSSLKSEKPRYKQHAATLRVKEQEFFLGPSARVDLFPFPAENVLDQKFQVSNSDLVVKKFSRS